MKYRPIIFNGEMVRAILTGHKTQTRRIVELKDVHDIDDTGTPMREAKDGHWYKATSPYGQVGDRLYVRETWTVQHCFDGIAPANIPDAAKELRKEVRCYYAADGDLGGLLVRPSIHMPRWASRITLEITKVEIQELQNISQSDAIAEGIERFRPPNCHHDFVWKDYLGYEPYFLSPIKSFASLWDSIYAKRGLGWDENPWVWKIEFKVVSDANP